MKIYKVSGVVKISKKGLNIIKIAWICLVVSLIVFGTVLIIQKNLDSTSEEINISIEENTSVEIIRTIEKNTEIEEQEIITQLDAPEEIIEAEVVLIEPEESPRISSGGGGSSGSSTTEQPEEEVINEIVDEIIQPPEQSLFDWNGDGVEDLLRKEIDGNFYVFPNYGTNEDPIFNESYLYNE